MDDVVAPAMTSKPTVRLLGHEGVLSSGVYLGAAHTFVRNADRCTEAEPYTATPNCSSVRRRPSGPEGVTFSQSPAPGAQNTCRGDGLLVGCREKAIECLGMNRGCPRRLLVLVGWKALLWNEPEPCLTSINGQRFRRQSVDSQEGTNKAFSSVQRGEESGGCYCHGRWNSEAT